MEFVFHPFDFWGISYKFLSMLFKSITVMFYTSDKKTLQFLFVWVCLIVEWVKIAMERNGQIYMHYSLFLQTFYTSNSIRFHVRLPCFCFVLDRLGFTLFNIDIRIGFVTFLFSFASTLYLGTHLSFIRLIPFSFVNVCVFMFFNFRTMWYVCVWYFYLSPPFKIVPFVYAKCIVFLLLLACQW